MTRVFDDQTDVLLLSESNTGLDVLGRRDCNGVWRVVSEFARLRALCEGAARFCLEVGALHGSR